MARATTGAPAAYYLRFLLADAPGTLAQVAAALGAAGISINRMRQVEHAGAEAPILIVTHQAERTGLDFLVLDQTRTDIEAPVVRVIVPGLRHFYRRFAPGRLYDVPVKLGWLERPRPEDELNPIHPHT